MTSPTRPARSRFGHRYNWRPDLPDRRDYAFSLKVEAPARIPSKIDLRSQCSPVVNQGKIGSCTGNALAAALEFLSLQQRKTRTTRDDTMVIDPTHFDPFSRLFIYYNERLIEGRTSEDAGAMLRDGIKSLVQWGACREEIWKYATCNVFRKPTTKAYTEAKSHSVSTYLRLQSLQEMKQCLAMGFPFVFGFAVYESFESLEVAKTGVMRMPGTTERMLGGHAVMAVGYDDSAKRIIVRNSWGTQWGQAGYFSMPYDYISHPQLAQDFWTVRK